MTFFRTGSSVLIRIARDLFSSSILAELPALPFSAQLSKSAGFLSR